MGLFDSISTILPAVLPAQIFSNFGSSYMNAREQSRTNDRMEANSWEAQRIQQGREDTAIQRGAKDATAAGFHPSLALGNPAGSSGAQMPSMTAPQISAPDILPALQFSELQKNNEKSRELTDAQIKQIKQQTHLDRNSATGAASKFWEGLINNDKSSPSLNSIFGPRTDRQKKSIDQLKPQKNIEMDKWR